jgi:hypothetical protein
MGPSLRRTCTLPADAAAYPFGQQQPKFSMGARHGLWPIHWAFRSWRDCHPDTLSPYSINPSGVVFNEELHVQ